MDGVYDEKESGGGRLLFIFKFACTCTVGDVCVCGG